jgi:MOSC domain-containing protein YiiM
MAHVHQINISNGGVPKTLVPRARVTVNGVVGDDHNDKVHHGGPDRALCLFSLEVIERFQSHHPGESRVYARVIRTGEITAGDAVRLIA